MSCACGTPLLLRQPALVLWQLIVQPSSNRNTKLTYCGLLYTPLLHSTDKGHGANGTFDHSKPAMQQMFVEDCINTVAKGQFSGCFIDRANFASKVLAEPDNPVWKRGGWDVETAKRAVEGCHATLDNLTATLPKAIILAKEADTDPNSLDSEHANAAMPTDTFCSRYHSQSDYNATECLNDILAVQMYAARGQLTESHGVGPLNDTTQREFTLACFLVAMGPLSYFSFASEDSAWSIDGTAWWPEYDKPLGAALGLAQRDGMTFKRTFESGTHVTVDVETHNATIEWATQS